MRMMNRRTFMKRAAQLPAGLAAGSILPDLAGPANAQESGGVTAAIPMPIQVVIDDVGWWNGHNGSQQQEPFRTGIARNHVPEDYQAIVDLGRALNIRPQAAMILCEWDRKDILRKLPTATWMGANWDNSKWVGPWMDKAADIIRNNRAHYELTMHGVGHEYWTDGKFTRAEWAERNGTMRPLDQVEAHLDAYAELLEQNQLGPFPTAWVPCAFYHGFGPIGESKISAAEVVNKRGIAYINTPFNIMANRERGAIRLVRLRRRRDHGKPRRGCTGMDLHRGGAHPRRARAHVRHALAQRSAPGSPAQLRDRRRLGALPAALQRPRGCHAGAGFPVLPQSARAQRLHAADHGGAHHPARFHQGGRHARHAGPEGTDLAVQEPGPVAAPVHDHQGGIPERREEGRLHSVHGAAGTDPRTGAGRADLRALALVVSAAGAVSWVALLFWQILPA